MQLRDGNWQRVDRADVPTQAPAPVDAGLVERMQDAYMDNMDADMEAALRVAADALLGPVTDAEAGRQLEWSRYGISVLLSDRRARLLAPAKTETMQERVEHILTKHFNTIGVVDAAVEIIATLKQEGAK